MLATIDGNMTLSSQLAVGRNGRCATRGGYVLWIIGDGLIATIKAEHREQRMCRGDARVLRAHIPFHVYKTFSQRDYAVRRGSGCRLASAGTAGHCARPISRT